MITETYKGRKIKVSKGREWGTLRVLVNSVDTGSRTGTDERAPLADVRATIDLIDQDPMPDGSRWGAEWYAPGTFELCAEGTHPMAIGGPCRHPYCERNAS